MKHWLLSLLLIGAAVSEITILEPESLRVAVKDEQGTAGNIDYSVSTFGHILYADTVTVEVLLDEGNDLGCSTLTHPTKNTLPKFVWLFERGTCTFAAKAFNSQQSGAYAVLVYHDREGVDVKNIIPSGDSFYNHLKIPIILITHEDGARMKEALRAGKQVFLTIDLELEIAPTKVAKFEFWMSPTSEEAYNFITKFRDVLEGLGDAVSFEPKYKFKDLSLKMNDSFLRENCYSGGKYCVAEKEIFEGLSVLNEGVRQICIWNLSQKGSIPADFWWTYVFHYRNCLRQKVRAKSPSRKHCFDLIQEDLAIPQSTVDAIDRCIRDSFTDPSNKFDSQNRLLDSNANTYEYADIYLVPAVFVNNQLVKEDIQPQVVLSALCDALTERPASCNSLAISNIRWEHDRQLLGDYKVFKLVIIWALVLSVLTFLLWVIRAVITSNVQEELSHEIRNHVTEYMKLNESRANNSFTTDNS